MLETMMLSKTAIAALLQKRFENESFKTMREIPLPNNFAGMDKAVQLIARALQHKRKIFIIGDYDVDGVVGTTLVYEFFESLGAKIGFAIPNRFADGYGISPTLIARLQLQDCLIITIDNGISAIEATEQCNQHNNTLIITDHHTPPPTLPNAAAIINPKLAHCPFPQKDICGANVGWYLIAALKAYLGIEYDMSRSLDLLAFAIIADVMPLVGVNRLLLRRGLEQLAVSERPACVVLRDVLKKNRFSSEDISYFIAPLLNSAGRMADASLAVAFLRAKNLDEAHMYFAKLQALNTERKAIENTLLEQALTQIDTQSNIALVYGQDWHEGVLGIVAARLCERTGLPSFVLTHKEGYLKGSGRSFGEINLIELLQRNAHLLRKFGGHKGAVGLEVDRDKLESFVREASAMVVQHLQQTPMNEQKAYIGEIMPESIDDELLHILDAFEPYGEANPKPRFLCRDLVVRDIRNVGLAHNHTALLLSPIGQSHKLKAIAFNQQYNELVIGSRVDSIFALSRDSYSQSPQLVIENLKLQAVR